MGQSLTDIMGQIRGGFAMHQAGKELEELIAAVQETKKKGKLTITISVEPDKVDERIITLQPDVKTTIPRRGFNPGIFFVDDNGKLSKEDPAQLDMQLSREREGVTDMQAQAAALNKVGRGPA